MERTKIEMKKEQKVFYEAVFVNKETGYVHTFIKDTVKQLQDTVDTWLRCGKYELKSAEKVERVMVKLIA
jgi:hypothetical protein